MRFEEEGFCYCEDCGGTEGLVFGICTVCGGNVIEEEPELKTRP